MKISYLFFIVRVYILGEKNELFERFDLNAFMILIKLTI